MKKFGFTLMEILVSLTVVGILAAIIVPQISSFFPDENKLKVLKIQKTLTEINAELLNDIGIYYETFNTTTGEIFCKGLACKGIPRVPPYNTTDFIGSKKYVNLLANKLDYDRSLTFTLSGAKEDNFYTKDGIYWEITDISSTTPQTMSYDLLVDFNGNNTGVDCSYSITCPNPDRFEFTIDNYGKVTGNDPLTKAYIENPDNLNDKAADFARAKELLSLKK